LLLQTINVAIAGQKINFENKKGAQKKMALTDSEFKVMLEKKMFFLNPGEHEIFVRMYQGDFPTSTMLYLSNVAHVESSLMQHIRLMGVLSKEFPFVQIQPQVLLRILFYVLIEDLPRKHKDLVLEKII